MRKYIIIKDHQKDVWFLLHSGSREIIVRKWSFFFLPIWRESNEIVDSWLSRSFYIDVDEAKELHWLWGLLEKGKGWELCGWYWWWVGGYPYPYWIWMNLTLFWLLLCLWWWFSGNGRYCIGIWGCIMYFWWSKIALFIYFIQRFTYPINIYPIPTFSNFRVCKNILWLWDIILVMNES